MYATRSPKIRKVDIIGDVHGCYDELILLIKKLGYIKDSRNKLYSHPEKRVLAFVGDLTDRGTKNRSSVLFALRHYEAGLAFYVQGNHDNHLGRWLQGGEVQGGYESEETIMEFRDMSDGAKKKLSERLLNLPLFATFDDGKLMLCHASPPVEGESRTRTLGRCLYGRPTKRTLTHINQRLDWIKDYVENADDTTPFVVYGHVCMEKPWMTSHTCGIDTACFGGNALTAFRWPEKEIIQVKSKNSWTGSLTYATPVI
jgi:protein phosphatase